jgi:type VI secretion system VasD/TssJ family lipoprotein
MKSSVKLCALFLFGALSCSCSLFGGSSSVNVKSEQKGVVYQANAITMNIKGNPQLNLYHDRSHPVYLCIYQLKEPNWFNQSAAENGGIENLMSCGRLDPSVAFAKRLVVQPGQELVESGDKAEGARYLGIVAGYYTLRKESVVRLYDIPKSRFSFTLELGPREIQNIKVK